MLADQFFVQLSTWGSLGVNTVATLLFAYWLWRIWRRTCDGAYGWLFAALGLLPLLQVLLDLPIFLTIFFGNSDSGLLHAYGNAIASVFFYSAMKYLHFILLFTAFCFLEGGRVGLRDLIPAFIRKRYEVDESEAGKPVRPAQGLTFLFWAVVAGAFLYQLALSGVPEHAAPYRIQWMRGWLFRGLDMLTAWWLYLLWKQSRQPAYVMLFGFLVGIPYLQGFTLKIFWFLAGPSNTIPWEQPTAFFYVMRETAFTGFYCLQICCMILALQQLAGGAVGFRELFSTGPPDREVAE